MFDNTEKSPFAAGIKRFLEKYERHIPHRYKAAFRTDLLSVGYEHERVVGSLHQIMDRQGRLAGIDSLTQLSNRKFFREHLVEVVKKERREGLAAIALFFIDLNDFKYINDKLGHKVGDKSIAVAGSIIRDVIRVSRELDPDLMEQIQKNEPAEENAQAGRWGGDEFLIATELRQPSDIEIVARRIKEAIDDPGRQVSKGLVLDEPLTAAVGGVSYALPEDGSVIAADVLITELVDYADQQMYMSKKDGRVHICYAELLNGIPEMVSVKVLD